MDLEKLESKNDHMPLVKLGDVRGRPRGVVYFFPGAGDGVTRFLPLSREIGPEYLTYGMQPRGLSENQVPYSSIESMVEHYVKCITESCQNLTIFLIGHSFGGLLVNELAVNLEDLGYHLGPITLIDSTAPAENFTPKTRVECLLSLIDTLEMRNNSQFGVSAEMLESVTEQEQLILIHKCMKSKGLISRQSTYQSIHCMVNTFIASCNMPYWPKRIIDSEALLLGAIASERSPAEKFQNLNNWKRFVPNLAYLEVSGNHVTMLDNSNCKEMAKRINEFWHSKLPSF